MKRKTIFRDQFGLISMARWYLLVIVILSAIQLTAGIIIAFIIVISEQPDFIPLAVGLITGTFLETIGGVILKNVSKNIEMGNISTRDYIEKKLENMESDE